MNGYIKIHRKMLNWEWYNDLNTFKLFMHCLLKANHKQEKWRGIVIEAGQFVTSLEHLAIESGLTVRQVRTALSKLKTTSELTSKTTSQYSIITIKNWVEYQTNDKQNDKQMTSERQTSDKRATTNKNEKNDKNEKNYSFMSQTQKSDPYFSPIKAKFENEYFNVYGKKPYLQRQDCQKLTELASDIDDFFDVLPEAIRKLKSLTFSDINFKPTASWLLKENNFSKLMNGEFETKAKVSILDKLRGEVK